MSDAFPTSRDESEREFLERSLADLEREHDAGDLDDADYTELKARYEAKLAHRASLPVDDSPGRPSRRSWVITVVVVLLVGVGGGLAVAKWSGARAPGETVTGSVPSTSAQQLAEAATLAGDGKVLDALKIYDRVLAENPEDVRALTYKGWLLRNVGVENGEPQLAAQGVKYLQQATEIDPTFSEAWFFRGIVYLRDDDDPAKAAEALKAALANDPIPEVATAARGLLAEIEQRAP